MIKKYIKGVEPGTILKIIKRREDLVDKGYYRSEVRKDLIGKTVMVVNEDRCGGSRCAFLYKVKYEDHSFYVASGEFAVVGQYLRFLVKRYPS